MACGWCRLLKDLGDDPSQVMMRQVIALFDEYQSRANAKHVLRAMKENARQGFYNGSRVPLGYIPCISAAAKACHRRRSGALAFQGVHVESCRADLPPSSIRYLLELAIVVA
jgi:hypothetical protein